MDVVVGEVGVPGARLYTETRGAGPLLLMIVGGSGDPTSYASARRVQRARCPRCPSRRSSPDLRRPVAELPGGYVGYAEHPAEFAAGLDALLRGHLPEQGDDGLEGCAGAS